MKKLGSLIFMVIMAMALFFDMPIPQAIHAESGTFTFNGQLLGGKALYYNNYASLHNHRTIVMTLNADSGSIVHNNNVTESTISFYNNQNVITDYFNLYDIRLSAYPSGNYTIDLDLLNVSTTATQFVIMLASLSGVVETQAITELNTSYYVTGGVLETYKVNYYNGLVLFYSTEQLTNQAPIAPPSDPIKEGYNFIGWKTSTGVFYDLNTIPSVFDYQNYFNDTMDTMNLYASFNYDDKTAGDLPNEVGNTPNNLQLALTSLGLWNNTGKITIFFFTLLLILIPSMIWLKLNGFILTFLALAITLIFAFLGLIPLYLVIILIGLFIFILWKTGGVKNE